MKSIWKSATVKLTEHHAWISRPGCKVLVLERGAVRFDFPQEWVVQPTDDSLHLYDKQPPDDNCRLAVSYMRVPDIDWSGLPISTLVEEAGRADPREPLSRGEIQEERRAGIEFGWRENRFEDATEKREACSLFCLARRGGVQALITFDFWAADRERSLRIWRTVLNTLELDRKYDAKTGRVAD